MDIAFVVHRATGHKRQVEALLASDGSTPVTAEIDTFEVELVPVPPAKPEPGLGGHGTIKLEFSGDAMIAARGLFQQDTPVTVSLAPAPAATQA